MRLVRLTYQVVFWALIYLLLCIAEVLARILAEAVLCLATAVLICLFPFFYALDLVFGRGVRR
jgi:hypothetical protein